jgi:elongation factor P
MPNATEIRKGQLIVLEKELWLVLDQKHVTPGNWRGFVQVTVRQVRSGRKDNLRLRSTDKIEIAYVDQRKLQYLYSDNFGMHFMDTATFEQFMVDPELGEEAAKYLKGGEIVQVSFHDSIAIGVDLPTYVELTISKADPGVRGDAVSNIFKVAECETGLKLRVPNFVNQGDVVKVDTRTGEFIQRV